MKPLNLTDKKILHIKIPKNATHSINNVLIDKDCWKREYFFGHDPLYALEKNNTIDESTFIFCVSRNPYTRFFSNYRQLLKIEPNYKEKTLLDFKKDIETNNLINFISDIRKQELNFLFIEKQVTYIKSNTNTPINKIYNLENIFEFENDFKVKLNFLNKSNYNISQYKKLYNREIVNFVKEYYEKDFLFFNYDFDFDKSISFRYSYDN